ncbi:MAG: phosphoribosylformylglycinamidine cyclo-ligase [Kineosporiaceae bacterium]
MNEGLTYAAAGVDVAAGDRAVELMAERVRATHSAGPAAVLAGAGGFAGLVDASLLAGMRRPVLATSTDGVGTKVAVAQAMDRHDTVGIDLVAMVVDDLVACGARPLFLTDYLVVGSVVPQRVAEIVGGVAEGCRLARCALVAGETAEHPGLLPPDTYDLAGAATGVVEADGILGPDRVRPGDVCVAMASSGIHANGLSLARAIVDRAGWDLRERLPGLAASVGDTLLEPTRIYAAELLDLLDAVPGAVHAVAHVTGGGLASNLARVLPAGTHVDVDRSSWRPPAVFDVLGDAGGVSGEERERTWNQGIGMVAVVDPVAADEVAATLDRAGVPAWTCGTVTAADAPPAGATAGTKGVRGGSVRLVAAHP